jgi:Kdo2-lipid IVA lauroyltransferase/acyltransferase
MSGGKKPPALPKRARRELRVRALLWLRALAAHLPHRAAVATGAALGWIAWWASARHRNLALRHLAIAFPERDDQWRRRTGRASFANLGRSALELLVADRIDVRSAVLLDEAEILAAHAEGRGVVAFSCHLGNWELLARRVALAGVPVATVAKKANDPRLTELLVRSRRATGIESLWRDDPSSIRELVRRLRRGEVIAVLIDQDTDVASHFVPFFGRAARTPRTLSDLAVREGAAVVFGRIHRIEPGLHRAVLTRVPKPGDADRERASLELTRTVTEAIEGEIRTHPDEWVWMHERWRTPPKDR